MVCSKFQQILLNRTAVIYNAQSRCSITTRLMLKKCRLNEFLSSLVKIKNVNMSTRYLFRDIGVNRLRNLWNRSVHVGNVVKRYRRDRSVREVFFCFRQALFRPRATFLLSASAAYKAKGDDDDNDAEVPSCYEDITDEELEGLLGAFDVIEELSKTIFCPNCNKRLVIDKRHSGIKYCICKEPRSPTTSEDGWEPYLEAEDTIIWRKEKKAGTGMYAYRVYGRYKDVSACHYSAVNVDTAYRRAWDGAVADLSVVERTAQPDQLVIHWEVLWPRLFANRDYVYLRRHKEYNVHTLPHNPFEERTSPTERLQDISTRSEPTKDNIASKERLPSKNEPRRAGDANPTASAKKPLSPVEGNQRFYIDQEKPSVHSNAKRKAQELYSSKPEAVTKENEVYVPEAVTKENKVYVPEAVTKENEVYVPEAVTKENKVYVPEVVTRENKVYVPEAVTKENKVYAPEAVTKENKVYAPEAVTKENKVYAPEAVTKENKVYVIVSRSCAHPAAPPARHAVRVTEYWSRMVVRSIDGADNLGMEFVLTYYDESSVGGLPSGVSSWATGRAAPAYLDKMREAARQYALYRRHHGPETPNDNPPSEPKKVSYREPKISTTFNEQDMESSKQGPDLEDHGSSRHEATQTEPAPPAVTTEKATRESAVNTDPVEADQDTSLSETREDNTAEEATKPTWWRYPLYYFL